MRWLLVGAGLVAIVAALAATPIDAPPLPHATRPDRDAAALEVSHGA